MLLYFVNNVSARGTVNADVVSTHPSLPYVASAWTNPTHLILTDAEGEILADVTESVSSPKTPTKSANDRITSLAWHPTLPVLAVGWSSGRLSACALPSGQRADTLEAPLCDAEKALAQHDDGGVSICVWSATGAYLLTASEKMRAVVWMLDSSTKRSTGPSATAAGGDDEVHSVDAKTLSVVPEVRSTFSPMWSVLTESAVTHAVHIASSTSSSGGDDECAFILIGHDTRKVFGLTEEQKLFPLLSMDEPASSVVYDAAERQLVVLTVGHLIHVYRVGDGLELQSRLRRKLSTPSPSLTTDRFVIVMCWAGAGLLAFACGDDKVRFYDIRTDSIYVVRHPGRDAVHVTHISTDTRKGLLAMATPEGPLAVFQHSAHRSSRTGRATNVYRGTSSEILTNAEESNTAPPAINNHNGSITSNDAGDQWEVLTVMEVVGRVEKICFTIAGHIVTALHNGKLQILRETVRRRGWDGVAAATQISMDMVVVESTTGCQCLLRSNRKVRGMSVAFPNIALWDGHRIDLYTINETTSTASLTTYVDTTSPAFAVHSEGLFYVKEDANRILFANFQLVTIGQLVFTESEGAATLIDVMGDVVVAISKKHAMRLARVGGRELRTVGPPRLLKLDKNVIVTDAKVNAQGRRVALMTRRTDLDVPDSRIWVYDSDTDQTSSFDFSTRNEMPDAIYWNTPEPNSSTIGELGYLLLACETHQVGRTNSLETSTTGDILPPGNTVTTGAASDVGEGEGESPRVGAGAGQVGPNSSTASAKVAREEEADAFPHELPDLENYADKKQRLEEEQHLSGFSSINPLANCVHSVVTLFATGKGLVVHNAVELRRYHICLVGLTIPDFLLASVRINGNPGNPEDYMIEQKRLRDFEGLKTEKDVVLLEALMKFSYYSTIGNMDEAYRCVQTVKNPSVWQNLAKMCVSSGRLDVADVCLAQMQDGVAARALREARAEYPTEKNVHLATLACSLGLIKDCETILQKDGRYDLVTNVLLACGKFDQAQRHVRQHDRIRLYPVAYKYAQFMESFSNFDAATMWYFNARCISTDVARIYFQNNRLNELRELVLGDRTGGVGNATSKDKKNPAETGGAATTSGEAENSNKKPGGEGAQQTSPSSTEKSAGKLVDAKEKTPPIRDIKEHTMSNRGEGDNPEDEEKFDSDADGRAMFEKLFHQNRDLLLWWAKHNERRRNVAEALQFYTRAEDAFNAVRLLCASTPPRIEEAIDLVNTEIEAAQERSRKLFGDPSTSGGVGMAGHGADAEPVGAAFFVGTHYERVGNAQQALHYFNCAHAYHAAARVAKAHNRHGELLALSLASNDTQLMLENAVFLEQNNVYDKAVDLYHRIGDIQKAIEVCIKGGLYDTMHRISTTLDAQGDPAVFLQMASHFEESGHYGKAAEMYVFARQFDRALELCMERGVPLTDEMADAMTSEANGPFTPEKKKTVLTQIAGIAKNQGQWNLACKAYTQIGERLKAIKMLMRGGDVNKVIFFANHSRNTEIYTLAGNFLQSQDWHVDPNIYKNILLFYTKAKAFDSLITFSNSYAQMQIDDNRNYYEAWRALDECCTIFERHRSDSYGHNITDEDTLRARRDTTAKVLQAQKLLTGITNDASNADEFISVCSDLIKRSRPSHQDSALISSSIRIGDVFALLARYYQECANSPKDALKVLESMVKHGVEPQFFVDRDLLESVCRANGRRITDFVPNEGNDDGVARSKAATAVGGRQGSHVTKEDSLVEASKTMMARPTP